MCYGLKDKKDNKREGHDSGEHGSTVANGCAVDDTVVAQLVGHE